VIDRIQNRDGPYFSARKNKRLENLREAKGDYVSPLDL